jgi:regulator of sigma E protease
MSILVTVIAFIVIFSILVLIHEWGHFFAARRAGIHVEEFGLGLPPRAKKLFKDKKGTLFSLNWIPFGGFVRMHGEDSTDPNMQKDQKSFISKTKWQRTQVIAAGVVMNFILGIVLLTIIFTAGAEPFVLNSQDFDRQVELGNIIADKGILIQEILPESQAEKSGLLKGDVVLKLNGIEVVTSEEIVAMTQDAKNKNVTYEIEREGKIISVPINIPDEGKIGVSIANIQRIKEVKKIKLPLPQAFAYSVSETGRLSVATAVMFADVIRKIVSQLQVSDNVAGPVGIAAMTHDVSQQGLLAILRFMAILSISLATINFLPLPALDGGRFLFIIVEAIRGKKANQQWEAAVHGLGFVFLMLLIAFITYKDIMRLLFST